MTSTGLKRPPAYVCLTARRVAAGTAPNTHRYEPDGQCARKATFSGAGPRSAEVVTGHAACAAGAATSIAATTATPLTTPFWFAFGAPRPSAAHGLRSEN